MKYSNLKDVYIELNNYRYFHSPSAVDNIDSRFRGRIAIQNKLKNILTRSDSKSGAYLVTGYRGVGKTSLVNKVLSQLVYIGKFKIRSPFAPIVLRMNLGHEELKEKDILKLIARSLLEEYRNWSARITISSLIRRTPKFATTILVTIMAIRFGGFATLCSLITKPSWMSSDFFDNMLLVVLFTAIYQIVKILLVFGIDYTFPTNASAIRRLKFLVSRLDSEVTQERNVSFERSKRSSSKLNYKVGSKKAYPIAEARDIEVELISVLSYIDRIWFKPRFIFVFDELDKIEANQNKKIEEKEKYSLDNIVYSSSSELTRKRQQTTAKILANLKHFFTTAKAKFIFIAGREMYDASLADTSDRNYFLGSIFHDIIYVNSFLTEDPRELHRDENDVSNIDPEHSSYYHSMVEEFVCQFLMPKQFGFSKKGKDYIARIDNPPKAFAFFGKKVVRKSISLKTYTLYLKHSTGLEEDEIKRVIILLKKFITYLAHRSSGSPKKLTHLVESYICEDSDILDNDQQVKFLQLKAIVARRDSKKKGKKLFLHFDYYSQYTLGLINYLTVPYYYNISRYVRLHNDKLMVSTTYLIDHLYKFHNFGFSWRNLEVTPEIIDVNKAPTLRGLIHEIVHFLSYTHLQHVVSGLYDFKFKKKLAYEINFLSKVSEREAAALNFTLDESQEVKGHFHRKLDSLLGENGRDIDPLEYQHSKGYIQQSLADLYYYDQEYDDASIIYKEAIQQLTTKEFSEIPLRALIVLSRTMLKLGLTFERKKAFASALMTYGQLATLIIKNLEINIPKEKKYSKRKPLFEKIKSTTINNSEYATRYRSETLETIRLLYQPFLAKLHVEDKEKIGGITEYDIDSTLDEVSFLANACNPEVGRKLRSEYKNKLGDLLFFKNSQLGKYNACSLYEMALGELSENGEDMLTLVFNYLFEDINPKSAKFEELKMLANNYGDYANARLCSLNESNLSFDLDDIYNLYQLYWNYSDLKEPFDVNEPSFTSLYNSSNVGNVFALNFISYLLYVKNDDYNKASFQCIKIFHIIESQSSRIIELIEEKFPVEREARTASRIFLNRLKSIVSTILQSIYRSYNASTRQEVERIKSIFKEEPEKLDLNFHFILNTLPSIGEVQEILMLFQLIRLRFFRKLLDKNEISDTLSLSDPSNYSNLNSMFGRLNGLYLKIRHNHEVFRANDYDKLFERPTVHKENSANKNLLNRWNSEILANKQLITDLIADTIYCLTETIRILKVFGINYITNHAVFGFAYEKRGQWCEYFEDFDFIERRINGDVDEISEFDKRNLIGTSILYKTIRDLIGSEAMSNLKAKYNYEKALAHFNQSLEVHEGKYSYDVLTENMYYLEDDFNDEHLHFFAALERLQKNSGKTRERILNLQDSLISSKIYDFERYEYAEEDLKKTVSFTRKTKTGKPLEHERVLDVLMTNRFKKLNDEEFEKLLPKFLRWTEDGFYAVSSYLRIANGLDFYRSSGLISVTERKLETLVISGLDKALKDPKLNEIVPVGMVEPAQSGLEKKVRQRLEEFHQELNSIKKLKQFQEALRLLEKNKHETIIEMMKESNCFHFLEPRNSQDLVDTLFKCTNEALSHFQRGLVERYNPSNVADFVRDEYDFLKSTLDKLDHTLKQKKTGHLNTFNLRSIRDKISEVVSSSK